jgi:hypothetical protein
MKLLSLFILALILMANMVLALNVYTELESEQLLPLEPKYNKPKPENKKQVNKLNVQDKNLK